MGSRVSGRRFLEARNECGLIAALGESTAPGTPFSIEERGLSLWT